MTGTGLYSRQEEFVLCSRLKGMSRHSTADRKECPSYIVTYSVSLSLPAPSSDAAPRLLQENQKYLSQLTSLMQEAADEQSKSVVVSYANFSKLARLVMESCFLVFCQCSVLHFTVALHHIFFSVLRETAPKKQLLF